MDGKRQKLLFRFYFNAVCESIKNLNVSRLYGLLLHNPDVLLGQNGSEIVRELNSLKDEGYVEKIGVSIYEPEKLEDILKVFDIDIVQLPFNIFNREVYLTGWAEKLKSKNIEIHVRSVFLQGILLLKRHNIPNWFLENWTNLFDQWFDFQKQVGSNTDTSP